MNTFYCHNESPIGITCQYASNDGRCLAATGWLGRLTVNCEYCKDYPPNNVGSPSSKKVDWSKGTSQPIKSPKERTCKTCKHSTKHTEWRTCQYYDSPDTDYQADYYICDIDGSSCFGMKPCKFYEPKSIKVKVKKCKR